MDTATGGDAVMNLAKLRSVNNTSVVESITVRDLELYEGQVSDMEKNEGTYKGYNPWPEYVEVKLRDDLEDESLRGKEYKGNGSEVFDALSEDFAEPGERVDDFWTEFEQPEVDGYTTWTVGNSYLVTLHVLGATAVYEVRIVENPIDSIDIQGFKLLKAIMSSMNIIIGMETMM